MSRLNLDGFRLKERQTFPASEMRLDTTEKTEKKGGINE